MTTGRRGHDLGRILHDPQWVKAQCIGDAMKGVPACRWRTSATSKASAISAARGHAAKTGHTSLLTLTHWQLVRPVKAD